MIQQSTLKIHNCDTLFRGLPNLIGVYSIISPSGEAAIIDTGPPTAYDQLKAKLFSIGITPETLTTVIITHLHIIHSAGSSLFSQDFPNAKFFIHPRSIPHLVDPSILLHQTSQFHSFNFGPDIQNKVLSIDKSRIVSATDGMKISFSGGGSLKIIHTPGHTMSHISIFEPETRTMFTGDSFGTRYRHIDPKAVFVSTPSSFNPKLMKKSINKMLDEDLVHLALPHYGIYNDIKSHTAKCMNWLDDMEKIAKKACNIKQSVFDKFKKIYGEKLSDCWDSLKMDVLTNSCGIQTYTAKLKEKKK